MGRGRGAVYGGGHAAPSCSAHKFAAEPGLDDWRYLTTRSKPVPGPRFGAAADLVSAIAVAADAADHHPDIDLRYPGGSTSGSPPTPSGGA